MWSKQLVLWPLVLSVLQPSAAVVVAVVGVAAVDISTVFAEAFSVVSLLYVS